MLSHAIASDNIYIYLVRIHLIVGQQVHTNIYMAARDGANLTAWSFIEGKPIPSKMPKEIKRHHYFIYTTSATEPHPDREFWVDIKVNAA